MAKHTSSMKIGSPTAKEESFQYKLLRILMTCNAISPETLRAIPGGRLILRSLERLNPLRFLTFKMEQTRATSREPVFMLAKHFVQEFRLLVHEFHARR